MYICTSYIYIYTRKYAIQRFISRNRHVNRSIYIQRECSQDAFLKILVSPSDSVIIVETDRRTKFRLEFYFRTLLFINRGEERKSAKRIVHMLRAY